MKWLSRQLNDLRANVNRTLPRASGPSLQSRMDIDLSRLASSLAGRTVEIRCWSPREWRTLAIAYGIAGQTSADLGRADLDAADCNALTVLHTTGRVPVSPDARHHLRFAVIVFTHELEHLSNQPAEDVAECNGMQQVATIAAQLGAPATFARELPKFWLTDIYPFDLPKYRSSECRDGGALDLHPHSSRWP